MYRPRCEPGSSYAALSLRDSPRETCVAGTSSWPSNSDRERLVLLSGRPVASTNWSTTALLRPSGASKVCERRSGCGSEGVRCREKELEERVSTGESETCVEGVVGGRVSMEDQDETRSSSSGSSATVNFRFLESVTGVRSVSDATAGPTTECFMSNSEEDAEDDVSSSGSSSPSASASASASASEEYESETSEEAE